MSNDMYINLDMINEYSCFSITFLYINMFRKPFIPETIFVSFFIFIISVFQPYINRLLYSIQYMDKYDFIKSYFYLKKYMKMLKLNASTLKHT